MTYRKGNIYKIICKVDNNICYIGSTFNEVRYRWQSHKGHYKLYLEDKSSCIGVYPYFTKYGIENFKAILIKSYLVYAENKKDHKHLSVYEQLWINKTKNCINTNNPFHIKKLFDKAYYERNKEKIKKNRKGYYEKNKEEVLEKQKEYNDKNKEKRNKKRREKILCVCGSENNKSAISRHLKTKKHLLFLGKALNKYVCPCGSTFENNKIAISRHEKSKKHLDFVNSQVE